MAHQRQIDRPPKCISGKSRRQETPPDTVRGNQQILDELTKLRYENGTLKKSLIDQQQTLTENCSELEDIKRRFADQVEQLQTSASDRRHLAEELEIVGSELEKTKLLCGEAESKVVELKRKLESEAVAHWKQELKWATLMRQIVKLHPKEIEQILQTFADRTGLNMPTG